MVERVAVESTGGDWSTYSHAMDGLIARLENTANPDKLPPDLLNPNTITGR